MALESANFITGLVESNPLGADDRTTSDDHHRLVKRVLKTTFPNLNAAVTVTPTQLNHLSGISSNVQTQLNTLSTGKLNVSATAVFAQSAGGAASAVRATSASAAFSAQFATSASRATNAISSQFATSAQNATNAVNATNATSAVFAASATNATSARFATSAAHAATITESASAGGAGKIELATNAEVSAGADTARAVTPAGLLSGLGRSAAENGWVRLPGGIIYQWGKTSRLSCVANTTRVVSSDFAISFTNVWQAIGTIEPDGAGSNATTRALNLQSLTTSKVIFEFLSNQSSGTWGVSWVAIGN